MVLDDSPAWMAAEVIAQMMAVLAFRPGWAAGCVSAWGRGRGCARLQVSKQGQQQLHE